MPRKANVKRTVERELRRVTPEEAAEITGELGEEAGKKIEAASSPQPGQITGTTKKSWQYSDLVAMFPVVSFTPMETIPLTFNGVRVQALAGVEMHVPICFKRIYDNHLKALMEASKSKHIKDFGFETTIEHGAGGLPPE